MLVRPDRFIFGGDRELTTADINRAAAAMVADLPAMTADAEGIVSDEADAVG